jgi:transposase
MVHRVQVRAITSEEGNRLLRIVRRSSGSVVTWRRAQMVLLSAQGMEVPAIARVTFTSPDRVRDVIHHFNADGFDSLRPRYGGGRPPKFTAPQRQQIKQTALARPTDHGLPFSTWSLPKLADFLVAQGVVDDISHEGLRLLLREEGVSFQAVKTWKTSTDPDYEAKKNRVLQLYSIADGRADPGPDDPSGDLHGRVRAAEPDAAPGPAMGTGRGRQRRAGRTAPATSSGDLQAITRGAASAGRLRPVPRQALRPRHQAQEPDRVPRVLPIPALAAPGRDPDRDRAGQLQPTPVDQDRPPRR